MIEKPRIRVPAGSQPGRKLFMDSFQNAAVNLGYGTKNVTSAGAYGFNPISRNRTNLEWAYRGSWLVRKVVDCPAKDMTRAGIDISSGMKPELIDKVHARWRKLAIWPRLQQAIKWGRLYGGAIAVLMIDGQDASTPLRIETVQKGSFKGLMVLDRWMVDVSISEPVTELGPDFGYPKYYSTITDGVIPRLKIHHSRVIRFEGDDVPYWQRIAENGWSVSVLEQMYDRMLAFDSATTGAAQLVYKAHLRTYSVEGLRELIGAGGAMLQAFTESIQLIRQMQSIEGMTVIDAQDKLETHNTGAFSGIADALTQFGQQLSGACGIPLVILFGQSPSGFSTGETDVRNYYDRISAEQAGLEVPLEKLLRVTHMSEFGEPAHADLSFSFNPLWQLTEKERSDIAKTVTDTVMSAKDIVSPKVALQELRQSSQETGIWSNISDKDIEEADDQPPAPPGEDDMPGANAGPGVEPPQPPKPEAEVKPEDAPPPAGEQGQPPPRKRPPPPPGTSRVEGTPDNVHVHVPDGHSGVRVNRG